MSRVIVVVRGNLEQALPDAQRGEKLQIMGVRLLTAGEGLSRAEGGSCRQLGRRLNSWGGDCKYLWVVAGNSWGGGGALLRIRPANKRVARANSRGAQLHTAGSRTANNQGAVAHPRTPARAHATACYPQPAPGPACGTRPLHFLLSLRKVCQGDPSGVSRGPPSKPGRALAWPLGAFFHSS